MSIAECVFIQNYRDSLAYAYVSETIRLEEDTMSYWRTGCKRGYERS